MGCKVVPIEVSVILTINFYLDYRLDDSHQLGLIPN